MSELKVNKIPSYVNVLRKEGAFLSFAAHYAPFHKELKSPIQITNKMMREFKFFLEEYELDYKLSSEKTFTTKNLSIGEHTIFFKVLNDEYVWSV